jgi:hypothetical protein
MEGVSKENIKKEIYASDEGLTRFLATVFSLNPFLNRLETSLR